MPNSCKCIIDRMLHKGAMTQEEHDKIIRKLDGTEQKEKGAKKMIIYKCDKCGDKLYQAELITMTVEHSLLDDFTADTYHFCPDCFQKFANWVDEEDDEDDLH